MCSLWLMMLLQRPPLNRKSEFLRRNPASSDSSNRSQKISDIWLLGHRLQAKVFYFKGNIIICLEQNLTLLIC